MRPAGRRVGIGHADERPYRRLTGDWIGLALATLIIAVTALNARDVLVITTDLQPIWGSDATRRLIGDGYL